MTISIRSAVFEKNLHTSPTGTNNHVIFLTLKSHFSLKLFVTSAPLLPQVFILQLEGQKRWLLYSPVVPLAAEYSVVPRESLGNPTHDITLKVFP